MQATFTIETNEDELYCSSVINEEFTPNRDLWKSWETINTENGTTIVDMKINHQNSYYYCRLSVDSVKVELRSVTKAKAPSEALHKALVNVGVEFDTPFQGVYYTDDIAHVAIQSICNGLGLFNRVTSIVENF